MYWILLSRSTPTNWQMKKSYHSLEYLSLACGGDNFYYVVAVQRVSYLFVSEFIIISCTVYPCLASQLFLWPLALLASWFPNFSSFLLQSFACPVFFCFIRLLVFGFAFPNTPYFFAPPTFILVLVFLFPPACVSQPLPFAAWEKPAFIVFAFAWINNIILDEMLVHGLVFKPEQVSSTFLIYIL